MKKQFGFLLAALAVIGFGAQDASAATRKKAVRAAPAEPVVEARPAVADIYIGPFRLGNPNVFVSGLVVGVASTGAYLALEHKRVLKVAGDGRHFSTGAYALTTVGCMSLAPMLASALVWNQEGRYLTSQEALGLGIGCIIPLIGPMIVDAAYAAHPEWPR